MSWTLQGETGRTLNAVSRAFPELNADAATLTFNTLAADTLTWSVGVKNATGDGTIVPDLGQLIEVHHDGIRRFRGHVTSTHIMDNRLNITAEGPWWWLQRIQLTQTQAAKIGPDAVRPSFVFPTQKVSSSMAALIDRAIGNGVPMRRGLIHEAFEFPRITLAEVSCAQALADLMSIVADAVAWFDYAGVGYPALNITRRGQMPTRTHTIGQDGVESISLRPRLDLEVEQVEIAYSRRDPATGKMEWGRQLSGTGTPGKRQIIVTSGPEPVDFLPADPEDEIVITSLPIYRSSVHLGNLSPSSSHRDVTYAGSLSGFILDKSDIAARLTAAGYTLRVSDGGKFVVSNYANGNLNGASYYLADGVGVFSRLPTTGMFVVTSHDRLPSWVEHEAGYTVTEANLTGCLYYKEILSSAPNLWPWMVDNADAAFVGYTANTGSDPYQYSAHFSFSIPVLLISAEFPTVTLRRPNAYEYVEPPPGMAAGLLAAQDWTPWTGTISLAAQTTDGRNDLAGAHNVANALPACAAMRALASSSAHDIYRGRRVITLGAPARTDFLSLASKFKRNPKDNIIFV